MAERSTTSMDNSKKYWLDETPTLKLVCNVVTTDKWYELGIQLDLDSTRLNEIKRDNPTTSLQRTKMFDEWLKTKPNPTNRQLLGALKIIEEILISENYEKKMETNSSLRMRDKSSNNQEHVSGPVKPLHVQPLLPNKKVPELPTGATAEVSKHINSPSNITDMVVGKIKRKISEDRDLLIVVDQLETKYADLFELIQKFASQYPDNTEIIKTKLKIILKTKSLENSLIDPYCEKIDSIPTVHGAFTFLIDNNLVGHINFQLLEQLSSEVNCGEVGNKKVQDKFSEYKKCYGKFFETFSFSKIIQVFDEYPRLIPKTIIGLPTIVAILSIEWKKRKKKDLDEWVPFIKENRALLQDMGYNCIRITYVVFPIDLLNIMDFLNDPNNIKTLKDNGISIETPSHTLEIEKLLREDERNNSLASTNHPLLQQLLEKVIALEKKLIEEEKQRQEDNDFLTMKITDLTNDLAKVKSKVKILEKERTQNKESLENLMKPRTYSSDDSGLEAMFSRASSISAADKHAIT